MPQTTLSYLKSLLECILYRITSGLLQKVILNFSPPSILRTNVPWQMGWPFSASHWNGETSWGRLCSQWWEKGKKLSKICGVPPALHKSDSPLQYYLPISSWNTLLRGLGLSCRELIINEVKTKPNRLQTPQCMTEAPDPRGSSPLWLPWLPGCLETPVGGALFDARLCRIGQRRLAVCSRCPQDTQRSLPSILHSWEGLSWEHQLHSVAWKTDLYTRQIPNTDEICCFVTKTTAHNCSYLFL